MTDRSCGGAGTWSRAYSPATTSHASSTGSEVEVGRGAAAPAAAPGGAGRRSAAAPRRRRPSAGAPSASCSPSSSGKASLSTAGSPPRRTGTHQRAVAMGRLAVDGQPPLLGHLAEQPGQPLDERRPVRAALGEGEHAGREGDGGHAQMVADRSSAWTSRQPAGGLMAAAARSKGGAPAQLVLGGRSVVARVRRRMPWLGTIGPVLTLADAAAVVVAGLVATDDPPATLLSPPGSPCWSPGPRTCTGPGWCSRSSRTCPGCSWPRPPRPRSWSAPARPVAAFCVLALACLVLAHTAGLRRHPRPASCRTAREAGCWSSAPARPRDGSR